MENDLVKKAISEGYEIAEKIRSAKSIAEVEALKEEIKQYSNFVNEEFFEIDEYEDYNEKYCELSFYLTMAIEEKTRHLDYGYIDGNEGVDDFIDYLNSKEWVKNSAKIH